MSTFAVVQLGVYLLVLVALAIPLGGYIARVLRGESLGPLRVLAPVERALYRVAGVRPEREMSALQYTAAVLLFSLVSALALYALQRLQAVVPLAPAGRDAVPPGVAFNTAVSFTTNTNWQAYGGETTMTPLTQMVGLTVQNFVSAAVGIAVLAAFVRGFARRAATGLGNFWADLVRVTLYVLLPLALVVALVLVATGVVQTLGDHATTTLLDGGGDRVIALGPVASQVAIKQLGTNGGGFFNVNSAHPLENPSAVAGFIELLAILLIPAALCFTFGRLVDDARQGVAVFLAMLAIFVPLTVGTIAAEEAGNPALAALAVDQGGSDLQGGGNLEGKEVRFGVAQSALWATATTAASNGSVDSMHDAYTPLGGLAPLWLIQLGEVVFGGVGSGLYGMLLFAVLAVFIAGLMVGRTPEYLGKKIEGFEIKMAVVALLVPAAATLLGAALAVTTPDAVAATSNPGPHGFSEILYAFSSAANNNGSAFAGLDASGDFYTVALGLAMLLGRYWVIVPVLAIAGRLAKKAPVPLSAGTLPTHTPLFIGLLVGVVLLLGALTFVPALALGPIAEHLTLP
ncbi:MAG: potassium-transporting ATPase subunit KdpA [Deltaproteobacteria bacterium]|nr:potassium-transporting ATPase subunit KdpA [Deltaproteobacteria bacterium]